MSSFAARLLPNFPGILLLGLLVLGLNGSDARAHPDWKSLRGHSACGGVDQYGKLQDPCGFLPATYVRPSIKTCPKDSFAAAGACYDCPEGFNRNLLRKVTHERACRKPIPDETAKAVYLGPSKCPSGSIFDARNGGECWSCPSGLGRTAAKVDQWNACGMVGKKAQAAIFVGRACPDKDAVRADRNGGECWKCPEDYDRTINAVTADKACKVSFAFASAIEKSDLRCAPGQILDLVDGGTCWTCPYGTKRTLQGIKTAKACRNNNMQWVVPSRQKYGIFGLGAGADDILAKAIAERTQIDAAVKKGAVITGEGEATALKNAWDVIDARPWDSPFLSALLANIVMDAALKPAGQRTESERALLARVAQLIQWNRQFVAYQAKQAHETWELASKKAYEVALSKMGAASVYADSMVTPPDYNEILVGSMQLAAGFAGPAGAVLVTLFVPPVRATILPWREITTRVVSKATGEVIKKVTTGGAVTSGSSAAAVAPLMIAAAAAVIVTMEIDKFMAMEKAAGQIRQAIAIADRPVDIGMLLQQKDGADDFLFHWASVIGAATKPNANFKARLAAYKAG